jgi:hypothetical protein
MDGESDGAGGAKFGQDALTCADYGGGIDIGS